MDHTRFFQLIAQDALQGAYYLHGEEEHIKECALKQAVATIDETTRDMNVQSMRAPAAQDLLTACETLPFFAPKRMIICHELAQSEASAVIAYLPKIPETTVLLLYKRGKADGRNALTRAFATADRDVVFSYLSEEDAVRYVLKQVRLNNALIEPSVARHLVNMVGVETALLYNEVKKVADYVGPGNPIERETLFKCITPNLEFQLFDMFEDLLAGRKKQGLSALYQMLQKDSAPLQIASFLAGRFRLMLCAKRLVENGYSEQRAVKALGGNPYAAKKAIQSARKYSADALRDALNDFSGIDFLLRSGQARDLDALTLAVCKHF